MSPVDTEESVPILKSIIKENTPKKSIKDKTKSVKPVKMLDDKQYLTLDLGVLGEESPQKDSS